MSLLGVQTDNVKAYLLALAAGGLAPSIRSSVMYALRSLYGYLRSENLVVVNPTLGLKVPGPHKARTDIYSDAEAEQILGWAADQPGGRGQVAHAVLSTLRYTGLRRVEISIVRLDGVDLDARRLSVVGKGDKPRTVPIPPPLTPVLEDYLNNLRPELPKSQFFFANPSAHRGHRYEGRFGPTTVAKAVQRAGAGAGVGGRHFPHRWRHTYATSLLRRGVDIHVVQRLMGHSNIATTIRYLHLCDADLADAVDKAFPAE